MAWFECTTGASSGNGVALIVTTDASFAGSNITASNGVDTFTQQCPSSAPYVVTFEDIPTGTYTISGVTGGQTVTKTYVVSDYNFEFHNTPTGSTATPVNVIQTWLHCADIWNKNYTTINQVLADTSTLLALISSNNAADYMARSTSWASSVCANQTAMSYIGNNNYCANKLLSNSTWLNAICNSTYMESVLNVKVPTMTSDTSPEGKVIYGAQNGTYQAFQVFDGNDASIGIPSDYGNPGYIGYKFTKSIALHYLHMYLVPNKNSASCIVKGSNNGTNWNNVATYNIGTNDNKWVVVGGSTKYQYWAVFFTPSNVAEWFWIYTLQFYGRA